MLSPAATLRPDGSGRYYCKIQLFQDEHRQKLFDIAWQIHFPNYMQVFNDICHRLTAI